MKKETSLKVHAIPNTGFARSYIIVGRNGLAAVDVGSKGSSEDIEKYVVERLGMNLKDLRLIIVTHFHVDHIGGVGHLIKRCGEDTRVLFNYMVKDYLNGKRKISLIKNWCVGLTPATVVSVRYLRKLSHLSFESIAGIPLPVIRNAVNIPLDRSRISFFGGDGRRRYRLGFEEWEVIETPGHTEDSVCFFNEGTGELISGDLIINISKRGKGNLNRFCWRRDIIKKSYDKLCKTIKPIVIYPGHGEVIKNGNNILMRVENF